MNIGTGIAIAGIWLATAAIVTVCNTRLSNTKDVISPFGIAILASIACGATYYVSH